MKRVLLGLPILLLISCSNPRNTIIPKDIKNLDSIKSSIDKLNEEDRNLLSAYLLRHTIGSTLGAAFGAKSDPIPDGMTIGKAIDEQRAFVKKQQETEAAEKAAKEKAIAERKALAAQMAQILTVRLDSIQLHKASFDNFDVENYINFTFDFENKGTKTITGIKGTATFRDKFGDIISELPIKIEETINPGKPTSVKLQKRYNQFSSEDQKLASIDTSSSSFELSPEVILFSDGTKFQAPQSGQETGQ